MKSPLTILESKSRLILIGLVVLGALLGALQLHPHLGVFNDDAEYLVLGDALASGQGYTWANDPLQPPHNKYPPGYPLTIAGVLLLTGNTADAYDGIIPAKLLALLAFAGSLVVLWLLLSRTQREPGLAPLLAVGLFAVNPFVLEYAVQIMSELPYTFVSLLALLAAASLSKRIIPTRNSSHSRESGNPPPPGTEEPGPVTLDSPTTAAQSRTYPWGRLFVLALLAALCYYVRGVGATVAISLILWLLFHRQLRAAILVGGVNVALIGLWQVRNALALPVNIYSYQFFLKDQEDFFAGTIGFTDLLIRVAANVEHYVLAGFLEINRPGLSTAVAVIAAAGWLIAALGWGVHLRRQFSPVGVYTFVYLGIIIIWPYASGRFLIPVLPFIGYYGLIGGSVVLERVIARRPAQIVVTLGTAALLCALILVNATVIRTNLQRMSAEPAQYYRYDPAWSSYLETAQWLRDNAEPHDVIMARRHFAMYVYSGSLSAKYRYGTEDSEIEYLLSGSATKYVVEDAFSGAKGDFLALPPVLEAINGGLTLVYTTPHEPLVRVWRLQRPPGATSQ
jgi:hypothetical protein